MQGVPEQFIDERDSARFRHLAQVPGVELYHAQYLATPLSPTRMKPSVSAQLKRVPAGSYRRGYCHCSQQC